MENYFHYFSEIEEHFQRRRGTILLGSTLDWALMDSWKNSGIPLTAVLRGIDETFDKYERRPRKTQKINSLAYCAQAVLSAAEEMQEAALGTQKPDAPAAIDPDEIRKYLLANASAIKNAVAAAKVPASVKSVATGALASLREIAETIAQAPAAPKLEEIERRLTVLEEKLVAALVAAAPEDSIVKIREEAEREMAPYKRRMLGAQIEQLQRQYVQRRLLEQAGLPRLSLFYMH